MGKRYSNSLRTTGSFDGKFEPLKPTEIAWNLASASGADFRLLSMQVGFEPLRKNGGSFSSGGPVEWQFEKRFTAARVTSEQPLQLTTSIVAPDSGSWGFVVRIQYRSTSQDWDGQQMYFFDLP